jgi:hypothetical protein
VQITAQSGEAPLLSWGYDNMAKQMDISVVGLELVGTHILFTRLLRDGLGQYFGMSPVRTVPGWDGGCRCQPIDGEDQRVGDRSLKLSSRDTAHSRRC